MKRKLQYEISEAYEQYTLKDYMQEQGFSRRILISLKQFPGSILLNQKTTYLNQRLQKGDHLTITLEDHEPSEKISPVKTPLDILYEDDDILVLNKPANMPIHPSQGNYDNTLANGVAYYYQQKGEPFVYRCINRLDRDTTGALVLAKHALSASLLSRMMEQRAIHRTYLAFVEGTPPPEGTVTAPIGRAENSILERQVDWSGGERAVTHYRLIQAYGTYSLIQLELETGRTHQIRVHMKYLGYPLPGDYLYHPNYTDFTRQPLHSWKLQFKHPITGKQLSFMAPLPDDMLTFMGMKKTRP